MTPEDLAELPELGGGDYMRMWTKVLVEDEDPPFLSKAKGQISEYRSPLRCVLLHRSVRHEELLYSRGRFDDRSCD